jgi:hypothetical protein
MAVLNENMNSQIWYIRAARDMDGDEDNEDNEDNEFVDALEPQRQQTRVVAQQAQQAKLRYARAGQRAPSYSPAPPYRFPSPQPSD